ncbi:hypothetical protein K466DRAFT_161573 [Polyporus arcularius HHB13444]|uniref:Uncharacterized protein n=1 Tax=Polyporus arcularius HHB13444 TaxID=1314778 RepID=A0A5C3PU91_9APHY|nr:hypothetical protein K466DRAFT_161573 [Polyporus arcularius HHB13444]
MSGRHDASLLKWLARKGAQGCVRGCGRWRSRPRACCPGEELTSRVRALRCLGGVWPCALFACGLWLTTVIRGAEFSAPAWLSVRTYWSWSWSCGSRFGQRVGCW